MSYAHRGIGGTGITGGIGGTGITGGIGGTGHGAGGIGGTGITGGIGGTGITGGIGGTGHGAGGIGGTGVTAQRGGIGGTGKLAESGIGGTGIVGIITGFGSICVNDIEIQYDQSTPVDLNGDKGSANELAVGQVVAAEAVGTGDQVRARSISVRDLVMGPIDKVIGNRAEIQVLGQTVRIDPRTAFGGRAGLPAPSLSRLRPGQFVNVSGFRQSNGTIVASRVEHVPQSPFVSVLGTVTRLSNRSFQVGDLQVRIVSPASPARLANGREVRAWGRWDGRRLIANELIPQPSVPFAGRVSYLDLQGFISKQLREGRLRIGGVDVQLSDKTRVERGSTADLSSDQLVRVRGRLTPEHRLVADHIEVERELPLHRDVRAGERGADRTRTGGSGSSEGRGGRLGSSGVTSGGSGSSDGRGGGSISSDGRGSGSGSSDIKNGGSGESAVTGGGPGPSAVTEISDIKGSGSGRSDVTDISDVKGGGPGPSDVKESGGNDRGRGSSGSIRDSGRSGRGGGDRVERPDQGERPDRGGRPESIDWINRPERVEAVERPEVRVRIERPERPESGRGDSGPGGGGRPEVPKPEKPEVPKPEVPKPEVPKPEVPKPEVPKPEVPKPEVPKPEVPKPEVPKPEVPKPEVPKPEVPKIEVPKPEKPEKPN